MTRAFRPMLKPLVLALSLAGTGPALAFQFKSDEYGVTGSLDTTLSYGISVRASNRDPALYSIINGGTSRSANEDDGNLNYDKNKPFANVAKATSEIELKWGRWGFFGRGTAFYDWTNMRKEQLGPTAIDRVGKNVEGLDGFVSASFEPFGNNLRLRAGRQVISWGESTFIANGINVISPVDLSKLRIPGAELKEAFRPTTGIWGNLELTKNASFEGFYLTNWDKYRIDPKGTYFSANDYAPDDGTRVYAGFGRRRDGRTPPSNPVPPGFPPLSDIAASLYGPYDPYAAFWAPRSPDKDPSDRGQWGAALRYLAEGLNNTEFGLYYVNYHSRIPLLSGLRGTTTSVLTGGPLIAPICALAATVPLARSLCTTGTGTYFAEYPEDIHLTGVSFNTQGPWGVALQGEYSYRSNVPLPLAGPELLLAALGAPNLITGIATAPTVPAGTYISGYRRLKGGQFQMTGTKSIPAVAGADALVVVGEFGYTRINNLPSDLKFNAPGVVLPATPQGAAATSNGSVQETGFVTPTSWGYRLVGRLDFNNALLGGNISPRLAWAHDVRGVGPTFNEGVKSASLGASWEYQRQWTVDMQYTAYSGGRTYCGTDPVPTPGQSSSYCSSANPLKDRDFYSFSVSYSF